MNIKKWVAPRTCIQPLLLAALLGGLATGCSTYQQQNKTVLYWRQGNLTNAVVEAVKMADSNSKNKDAIIWRLEDGAVLRANGQYEDSNKAFDQAEEKIDDYEQKAKVSVSDETGALLSNQAELPYEGRSYDGIMLNTYKALNYLALGEPDKARPEIIRAYQREQDAVEANKKRIEKIQNEAAKNKDKATIDKAQGDTKFQASLKSNYSNLDSLASYADYVNPFTVYLDGLYFMANAADTSDMERAHKSFERCAGFAQDNEYIKQDLSMMDDLMNGKPLKPTTYVIFETGCAPDRGQIRIDIPIIVSKVSYVGAAFPTLQIQGNYLPSLTVTANSPLTVANDPPPAASADTNSAPAAAGGTASNQAGAAGMTATTSLLASMDGVIGLDFKNEMPVVVTKTIASTVVKAVAAYAINESANQQSALAGLFAQVVTASYQAAVNVADTRTWTTLPKEFQVCRFPTPSDRKITLETTGGVQTIPVTIQDGTINIVYVKSISATTPLLVSQMKLK